LGGYNEGRYGCFEKTSKNRKGANKEFAKESAEIGKSSGFLGLKMILYGSQKRGQQQRLFDT